MAITTTKSFYNLFDKLDEVVKIVDKRINHEIEFTKENYNVKGVRFINCTFIDSVVFNELNLGAGVFFEDCKFQSSLHFKGVTSNEDDFGLGTESITIKFIETKIEKELLFNNCSFDRTILFKESKLNFLNCIDLKVKNGSIDIIKSEIISNLHFEHCRTSMNLNISESTIHSSGRYSDNDFGSFVFQKSLIKGDQQFWAGRVGDFIFNDGIYEDEIKIKAVKIQNNLTIAGDHFKKSCSVDFYDANSKIKGSVNEIYVTEAIFEGALEIKDSEINSPVKIDTLLVKCSQLLKGALVFNNLQIDICRLEGANYNANLTLDSLRVSSFEFQNFSNYSKFMINNLKPTNIPEGTIMFDNSLLGDAWIINTNLYDFKKVIFINSDLTQLKVSNVTLFDAKKLYVGTEVQPYKYVRVREVYRQLRNVMESNGLKIHARYFKQKEYQAFYNELKINRKNRWGDYFIMLTNTTNDFGASWIKPVWYASGFTLLFYYLIIFSFEPNLNFSISFIPSDIIRTLKIIFSENIYLLPQLLNPTHLLGRIVNEGVALNFWSYFWDFFQKLSLAFFIFQIVVAFRKYSK